MFSIFYKVSTNNLQLHKKYLSIINLFHLNNNSPPGAIYATTAFGFWILVFLSVSLKMCKFFLKKIVMLINTALFSQMLSLFSRNAAFIQISLIEIYTILQLLEKFNGTA